jgi:AraC-like DNA-binding protein
VVVNAQTMHKHAQSMHDGRCGLDFFDGLYIGTAGRNKTRAGINANYPKYYGIQFLYSGGLYLRVDKDKEYKVEGPCAFLTYPGHCFEYGPLGEIGYHYWICFFGPRSQQYLDSGLFSVNSENPVLKITRIDKFLASVNELLILIRETGFSSGTNRIVLLIEDILLQLYEQRQITQKKIPKFQQPFFEDLLSSIKKTPWKDWDFEKETVKLSISRNHFSRLFKDISGYAPQTFLIQARLSLAAEFLTGSTDSIRSIASRVGIENEFYFSRLFKKRYYLSPREYRRETVGEIIQTEV